MGLSPSRFQLANPLAQDLPHFGLRVPTVHEHLYRHP
jgi:hypothetical protein